MTRRMSRVIATAALSATALSVALAGGCAANNEVTYAGDVGAIRANPSPMMGDLHRSEHAIRNDLTVMSDENLRMMREDVGRTLYLDRPSRLTPAPVAH